VGGDVWVRFEGAGGGLSRIVVAFLMWARIVRVVGVGLPGKIQVGRLFELVGASSEKKKTVV